MAKEFVPGNVRLLVADTRVGAKVFWEGNFERHEGYRGRLGARQLLMQGGRLMERLLLRGREMVPQLLVQVVLLQLLRIGMMILLLLIQRGC